jgi:aldose 1-epimerase
MAVKTTIQAFGEYEGRVVNKYTITRDSGILVSVINYGATVTNIIVPDKAGAPTDVVLGFDSLEGYINSGRFYFGGICGRYANRIKHARFRISGHDYQVSSNDGVNCLHGGYQGFDKKFWEGEILPGQDGVRFIYHSKDGEEGFPGNLDVRVTYTVADNALHIDYEASTDKASPVNLTSHVYFNLSGGDDDTILDHYIRINSNKVVEVGDGYIPTGNIIPVVNSPFDFTEYKRIGDAGKELQGFDYSWVLDKLDKEPDKAVSLIHKPRGLKLTVYTTQPAVHFYSGRFLDGRMDHTKSGIGYDKYAGLCLETQHFPDSPNQPEFPDTIIRPGELYREKTIFSFGIEP